MKAKLTNRIFIKFFGKCMQIIHRKMQFLTHTFADPTNVWFHPGNKS